MNFFKGYVLGSGGVMPTKERNVTAIYCKTLKSNFLIDAGEGFQKKILERSLPFFLDFIVISHHHLDHFLGLFGYLNTLNLLMRKVPLKIYTPDPTYLTKICKTLRGENFFRDLTYTITFIKIIPDVEYIQKDLSLKFFRVSHSILCYGVMIYSLQNELYSKEALFKVLTQQEINVLMKEGVYSKNDRIYKKEDFLTSLDPHFNIIYSGDTYWDLNILSKMEKAVILHECTHFLKENLKASSETLHTNFYQVNNVRTYKTLEEKSNRIIFLHLGPQMSLEGVSKIVQNVKKKSSRVFFCKDGSNFEVNNTKNFFVFNEN